MGQTLSKLRAQHAALRSLARCHSMHPLVGCNAPTGRAAAWCSQVVSGAHGAQVAATTGVVCSGSGGRTAGQAGRMMEVRGTWGGQAAVRCGRSIAAAMYQSSLPPTTNCQSVTDFQAQNLCALQLRACFACARDNKDGPRRTASVATRPSPRQYPGAVPRRTAGAVAVGVALAAALRGRKVALGTLVSCEKGA